MIYSEYGRTGKQVSAIGFGGMRFSEPQKTDEMAAIVTHAYDKGINYFDTAPGYCDDQSEIIMGRAITELKRRADRPFYVSTKSMKVTADDVRRDLERSLRRLNVDTIDFYHCWYLLRPEDLDARIAGGAIEVMMKAKEEGLVNHVTFSTHLPGPEIVKVIGRDMFEGVLLGYSAINFRYREEGIAAAHAKGMGVVVMNPLGGGTIVQNEESFGYLKVHENQNMLDGALHFLLNEDRINVRLVGFRNKNDIDTAVSSVESFVPYTEEEIQTLRTGSSEKFNALCTGCTYCKDCPVDIPVWKFVETANLLYIKDGESVHNHLKYYWGVSIDELDTCISCRKCEEACTQHLPILDRFEELKKALKAE